MLTATTPKKEAPPIQSCSRQGLRQSVHGKAPDEMKDSLFPGRRGTTFFRKCPFPLVTWGSPFSFLQLLSDPLTSRFCDCAHTLGLMAGGQREKKSIRCLPNLLGSQPYHRERKSLQSHSFGPCGLSLQSWLPLPGD